MSFILKVCLDEYYTAKINLESISEYILWEEKNFNSENDNNINIITKNKARCLIFGSTIEEGKYTIVFFNIENQSLFKEKIETLHDIFRDGYVEISDDISENESLISTIPKVDITTTTLDEFLSETNSKNMDLHLEDISINDIDDILKQSNVNLITFYDTNDFIHSNDVIRCAHACLKGICRDISFNKLIKIMGMINYQNFNIYKKYPYEFIPPISCTRLELESEMCDLPNDSYDAYRSVIVSYKIEQLINEYNPNRRSHSELDITSVIFENIVGSTVSVIDGRIYSIWQFKDGIWVESTTSEIWKLLSETFGGFMSGYISEDNSLIIDDIIKYIKSVATRERIQKDLLHRLEDNKFLSKLNTNHNLIGMSNGVYDTDKGSLRKCLPGDYISMSTKNTIFVNSSIDAYHKQKLLKILETIFPNKNVRKFFIKSCASLLEGKNKNKLVYIWWGKGNNAKSMMEKLVQSALGDYAVVSSTSLITGKRSGPDNATPQLSNLEGKLVAFLQEPNPNESIKIGVAKELSGGDAITARGLFKSTRTFIPKFKLVIVCNNPMYIPDIDIAFRNRLVVIPFVSTFLREQDYKKKEKMGNLGKYDFAMDTSIEHDIPKYSKIFLEMMIEEYKNIKNKPLKIPKIIAKTTENYIEYNNLPLRFINTQVTKDTDACMYLSDLHTEFRTWVANSYPGKSQIDIEGFEKEVINQGYKIDNDRMVHGIIVTNRISFD